MSDPNETSTPERMASGEALDQVMYVVRPRTWLALIVIGVLLAAAVAWGIWGSVATKVVGQGILMRSGTLFPIVTVAPGQLLRLEREEGQSVNKGALVATLDQPLLRSELKEAESLLDELEEARIKQEFFSKQHRALVFAHVEKQHETLNESIRLGRLYVQEMESLVESLEGLRDRGVVNILDLEKQKGELRRAQITLLEDQQKFSGLDLFQQQDEYDESRRFADLMKQIIPARERVRSLQERLKRCSEVRSLHNGVLVEIHRNPGEMLQEGDSVATLEVTAYETSAEQDLLAVAYVPPFQGLELRLGMPAQVIPETVREEEYGVILGEILSISPYPVSPQGMMRVLDNPELARVLMREGAPIMVKIRLYKARNTLSGYRWSSGKGPPTIVKSGSQCLIRIIARRRAPIKLIVPGLKRRFFGIGETPSERVTVH